MDIRINRFSVSHQGKIYGPGDVIYGIDESEGSKLVNESNGEMEELPRRVNSEQVNTVDINTGTGEKTGDDIADNSAGLPQLDPSLTVKGG